MLADLGGILNDEKKNQCLGFSKKNVEVRNPDAPSPFPWLQPQNLSHRRSE